jgi:hypothetical protein
MLGFNGGLMGVRRVPATGAASGLWFQNEQSVAKRASIWPPFTVESLSPVLWYDFSDETTVTTSGTEITAVTSKGSRAWTLSKSTTGPQYVTGINGKKCLDWGNASHSNYLRNTDTTSTSIAEVYVVMDAAGGTSGQYESYAGLFTGTGFSAWYFLGFGTSYTQSGTSFDQAFINGGTNNRFSTSHFDSPSVDDPAIVRINYSVGTTFNATDGFQIGIDRTNAPRSWKGLIGEYIVFSSVLNATDRNALQSYLAAKWGITLV